MDLTVRVTKLLSVHGDASRMPRSCSPFSLVCPFFCCQTAYKGHMKQAKHTPGHSGRVARIGRWVESMSFMLVGRQLHCLELCTQSSGKKSTWLCRDNTGDCEGKLR
eukprot:1151454-Pelagomonas_calceolata.AAC.7